MKANCICCSDLALFSSVFVRLQRKECDPESDGIAAGVFHTSGGLMAGLSLSGMAEKPDDRDTGAAPTDMEST